jgi:hypothetical protein
MWSGADDPLDYVFNSPPVHAEEWQAKLTYCWPNGHERRAWYQHNFKGHSQFNSNHGLKKAQLWTGAAHWYGAGHLHTWELTQGEDPRGDYTLFRARGYKALDSYAVVNGFHQQEKGASIAVVIDPKSNHEWWFHSVEAAAKFLAFLRG